MEGCRRRQPGADQQPSPANLIDANRPTGLTRDRGKTVEMWQHLKIGAKDSENRTLRIHFCWDEELAQVVIGHCGKHLYNPKH